MVAWVRLLAAALLAAGAVGLGGVARADDPPLTLPDLQTDEGALAHLLLAESLTPFNAKEYDADAVFKGMKAIRAIVDNRRNHIPPGYKAKDLDTDGATSDLQVIGKAKFQGFSLDGVKLKVTPGVQKRLDDILKQANTGKPGKFHKHVSTALAIARGAADDPFKGVTEVGGVKVTGRTYGMFRDADNKDLGGDFVYLGKGTGLLGGNRYYTLKKRD